MIETYATKQRNRQAYCKINSKEGEGKYYKRRSVLDKEEKKYQTLIGKAQVEIVFFFLKQTERKKLK